MPGPAAGGERLLAGPAGAPPEGPPARAPGDTPPEEVEQIIGDVASKAAEWAALPLARKLEMLRQCLDLFDRCGEELREAACASRGYDPADEAQGHLVADATILSQAANGAWLRGSIELVEALLATGRPPVAKRLASRPDGTYRAKFVPKLKEWLLMDRGTMELVVRGAPRQFNPMTTEPSLTGVLGAGNTEILNDILDPLCRLNSVVVYKSNPVLAISNRIKEKILAPLIEAGYIAFVYGGAEQGRLLTQSNRVSRVVLTGSHNTFDRIVWGDQDKCSPSAQPLLTKPVAAELGSVNPYIVVPGDARWKSGDIEAQAEAFVAYKLVNSGHICAAPQVLITCRAWPQRGEFLEAVRRKLAAAPATRCFYPGIDKQYNKHLAAMGSQGTVYKPGDGMARQEPQLDPVFMQDVKLPTEEEPSLALRDEAFCPVIYELALDGPPEAEAFLQAAVDFCHSQCWGSLTCTVIIDDRTRARCRDAFEAVLDQMRFGVIGVNVPPSVANAFPLLTWGAFPGHSLADIQSGTGYLGNFGCYKDVEKAILTNRFSNRLSFTLATDARRKRRARRRAARLAAVLTRTTAVRFVKFGAAEYIGI